MIPLNLKELASRNQLLWISIFFAISLSANADENKDAEYYFQTAKMAYEDNMCEMAIHHFKRYLDMAEEVEQRRKTSIKSAMAWCYNHQDIFRRRIVMTGGDTEMEKPDLMSGSEEQIRLKKAILESKPAVVTAP